MNNNLIELQAKLDEAKSKGQINADIAKLQKQLDKLKLQTEVDSRSISKIAGQLETALNQQVTISNLTLDPNAGQQIGNDIAENIAEGINKANDKIRSEIEDQYALQQTDQPDLSWVDKLKQTWEKFDCFGLAANAISALVSQLCKIPQEVIKINSAMGELKNVSNASASEVKKFFGEAAESARKYGSSVSDMINATAGWSRLGYSLPDSKKLAEAATLYTHVGDGIDMDSANNSLLSALQGYQLEADDALSIIDKLNAVADNFPIDSTGIGEALQQSAASFYAANTDLSKSIALITGTNSIVQDPDTVGNMWKTVSMRISEAKQELESAGEKTDGMVASALQLRELIQGLTGFDIMSDKTGTPLKDVYDIIVGIGHEWKSLTDGEQTGLSEALAGKGQSNALSAALNNISMIEEAYDIAESSAGSALMEQEKYEQGIDSSLKRLEASFQTFSNHILDSSLLKGIIDFGNGTISTLDAVASKIGSLGTIGLGTGLFAGLNNVGGDKMCSLICFECADNNMCSLGY